ncbi:MAG TPA: dTDP-4-dehydrorhamnose 3,5-epimerase family protein [Candidatus Paceibacterota bacterium]|nr:dTDP-4-dehydrorhamnose 3,5-epimerase family protein [Candidatus Paceibacterota bacterium]
MKTSVALEQIQGVRAIKANRVPDNRGSFTKFFEVDEYRSMGSCLNIDSLAISENTSAGTLRGLHFQVPPHEEEKLILCIEGRIYDVIVDLRPDSSTVGRWASIELDADHPTTLILPKGIAHGFQTLTPNTKVIYGICGEYVPTSGRSLLYSDPSLRITWPLPISQISTKDKDGILLAEAISPHSPERT